MASIPKSNVANGNTIQASDLKNVLDALDGTTRYDLTLTGSLNLTGSIVTGSISNATSASWASSSISASYAISSSYASSSVSASYALSSSYAKRASSSAWDGNRFGDSTITGDYSSLTGISLLISGNNPVDLYLCSRIEQGISGTFSSFFGNNTGYNYIFSASMANTAFGFDADSANVTGSKNAALGYQSLRSNLTSSNTAIGYKAGSTITTGANNSFLGHNAQPAAATDSNNITFGDANITKLRCATQTITALSDRRDKKEIKPLNIGLDFINELKPVTFVWDMRSGHKKDIPDCGFIAQELDETQTKFEAEPYLDLVLKSNPDKLEASYGRLLPVMIKAIQDLSAQVEKLNEEIYILKNK